MLSPTTLTFSVLALVLGEQPRRTGLWFYLGALGATLLVGVVAAFVLGDVASAPKESSQPKTWVSIVDLVFGAIALKDISELDPTAAEYVVSWVFFSLVSLLPLAVALLLLVLAPGWTKGTLAVVRSWLERNARNVAAAIVVLLAISLLRSGIAGLTG